MEILYVFTGTLGSGSVADHKRLEDASDITLVAYSYLVFPVVFKSFLDDFATKVKISLHASRGMLVSSHDNHCDQHY